jgi:hypothetical protein
MSGSWKLPVKKRAHEWTKFTLEWEILRPCRYEIAWLKENFEKLICTTYINKMHLLFGSPFCKNSTVKSSWFGGLFGWVTFWEVPRKFVSEEKTHWKDSCWFLGSVSNTQKSSVMLHDSHASCLPACSLFCYGHLTFSAKIFSFPPLPYLCSPMCPKL